MAKSQTQVYTELANSELTAQGLDPEQFKRVTAEVRRVIARFIREEFVEREANGRSDVVDTVKNALENLPGTDGRMVNSGYFAAQLREIGCKTNKGREVLDAVCTALEEI